MNLNWDELKEKVYFEDGSFRDIYVFEINVESWKKWAEFVNQNYEVEFLDRATDRKTSLINFSEVEEFWNGTKESGKLATVKIDGININCHFFSPGEFENDILPKEINSLQAHERLTSYLKDVSRIFNKKVLLTDENAPEFVLLEIDSSEVSIKI